MSRDFVYLLDILQAAKLANSFVKGLEENDFACNSLQQSAVLWQLEVMGEDVKRLSMKFRGEHPNIPWKKIAGMRDVLIHCYDGIDMSEVWITAKEKLPPLIEEFEQLIPAK